MELFDALPSVVDRGGRPPSHWLEVPALSRFECLGVLIDAIARHDSESDVLIGALLGLPHDDELVAPVLIAGLRNLLFLCRGSRRELLDDLLTEVAIAIGELRRVRPLSHRRRFAYVIIDRARDRQRASLRRDLSWRPVDSLQVANWLLTPSAAVEDEALNRVTVASVRETVASSADMGLRRSWNSLVELVDAPRESQAERDRWKYVRRRLTDHFGPDAA